MTEIHPFQGLVREELHPKLEALKFVRMDKTDQNVFNSYSYKILGTDFSSDNWNQFWNGHFFLSSDWERGESGITEGGWGVMKGQAVASAQQWQILHYTTHSNYSNMILRHEYDIQQQQKV